MATEEDSVECKCNTCKAIFSCIDKVKEHYRSEWHILNSKRRASGLPPLTRDEFKKVKPMMQSAMPKKAPSTQNLPENTQGANVSNSKSSDNGIDNVKQEDEVVVENTPPPLPVAPTISLFDNKEFDTTDECMEYMGLKYGFFIPDMEFVCDLDGLLVYLGDKIKLGGYCLYCQKQFRPGYSCQNHMISKSHCKLAYEEGVDLEEYEDFFDFSASYTSDDEFDEDGNLIEKVAEVSAIGELILPNGKTVGNRIFRRYYRQKFAPQEDRPSVLALQREELLRLGNVRGTSRHMSSTEVSNLSDAQVMIMLMQKQKEIRKGQIIEQRARMQQYNYDQRREYQSTTDKLRSSATTTEKIRDYHRLLQ